MDDLGFQPLIPSALWLALAVVTAVALLGYALRRPEGISRRRWTIVISFMTLSAGIVLVLLLNPTWSHEIPMPDGKPALTVLVDASRSMATPDAAGGASRFKAAGEVAQNIYKISSDRFDANVEQFDNSIRVIDPSALASAEPNGISTDIATAIQSCLMQDRSAGQAVVLLSDGIPTTGGGTAAILKSALLAKSLACPIYVRTFGGDAQSIDLSVELKSPQDMAIIGQKIPISATVTHKGQTSGRTVVTLMLDGNEVDHRDVVLDPNGPSDVHFLVAQEKVGLYPYELRVQPLQGQTSLQNTTAAFVLRVVDQPIRVLMLEGKPYWDSKFFIRTLSDDSAIALDAIIRINDGRLMQRTLTHHRGADGLDQVEDSWKIISDAKSALASADRLNGYQVVVLGRDVEAFLDDSAIANLQNWMLQQGGALVCYRGSPTQQPNALLDRLLPVQWAAASATRFHVTLTSEGQDLDWVQDEVRGDDPLPGLPTLAANDSVVSPKPLAVVLASGETGGGKNEPVVVYHSYGTGRAITVEGSGMWRWAFLPPQYQEKDQIYSRLWHSMMRWLTSGGSLKPGQLKSLRADRVRFSADEPATATLLVRAENGDQSVPTVELRPTSRPGLNAAASAQEFTPTPLGTEAGVFRVVFGKLPEGRYQAVISDAKPDDPSSRIVFDVRKFDQEDTDLQARPDLMARIASISGGAVLSAASSDTDFITQFRQEIAATHPPQIEYSSAWDHGWLLVSALALWIISWSIRRSGGLI